VANETKSPIEAQIQKIREALNRYKKSSVSLSNVVGPTTGKGLAKFKFQLWKGLKGVIAAVPNKLLDTLKDLSILAAIDICSVLNTQKNIKNRLGSGFNPNNPQPEDFEWRIKKLAYDTQIIIDLFIAAYQTSARPGQLISGAVAELSQNLGKLTSSAYLGSSEIRGRYPQVDKFTTYLNDQVKYLSTVGTVNDSDKKKQEKLIKSFDKIKKVCVFIQSTSIAGEVVAQTIALLDRLKAFNITDPNAVIITLTAIITSTQRLNSYLAKIVKTIQDIQAIIKICLVLIKVFRIIIFFLEALPIPNLFTVVGVTTKFARLTEKLDKYAKDTINLLNEINTLLAILVDTLDGISEGVDLIIVSIQAIIDKIKSCDRSDNPETEKAIESSLNTEINNLRRSNQAIRNFTDNYKNKKKQSDNTYNGYTISILKEQIFDQEVRRTVAARRYGVALDDAGIVAVQSPLTFATDDSIIISEVKLLLASKGLIKVTPSVYSPDEQKIINEAINLLQDPDLDMEDITTQPATEFLDAPLNEDENDQTGLNAFINKLKGGKELRSRVRQIVENLKTKLNSDVEGSKK
jgi:hypothetical protein